MRKLKSIPNPIEQAFIIDVEHNPIHLSYLLLPFLSPFFLARLLSKAKAVPRGRCAAAVEGSEGVLQGGESSVQRGGNAGRGPASRQRWQAEGVGRAAWTREQGQAGA